MTAERKIIVARPSLWKSMLRVALGLFALGVCVWITTLPLPDTSCLNEYKPACPRRPVNYFLGYWAAWFGIAFCLLALWRIIGMRGGSAPYLVINDISVQCREWHAPVAWADIESVRARAYGHWLSPKSWRIRDIVLTTHRDVQKQASASSQHGVGEWMTGKAKYMMAGYDPVSGRYRIVLNWLDRSPDDLLAEIRKRLKPTTEWRD